MSPLVRKSKNQDNQTVKSFSKTDPEFLQKILRQWENDSSLEVTSVDEIPACGVGVNYMSVVNRINVTGKRYNGSPYQISLISKNLFDDKCHQEVFHSLALFSNETKVYEAFPSLFSKEQKLFPNCLYADGELIVLEDLKSLGFIMADKLKGLDFDHAKLVMETLAKFHAASFVLEYTEPEKYAEIRKNIKEVVFPPSYEHNGMKSMMNNIGTTTSFFLQVGATPEDNHAKEIAYLSEIGEKVYDILKELIRPKKYAVMCAGDCWISNLLFKYEEFEIEQNKIQRVSDVRLIDFQGARFSSVATDILYFLHTSVDHTLIKERYDEIIQIYHATLIKNLSTRVPSKVIKDLSIDWLKNELKTHEQYGFFMSLWLAPMTTLEQELMLDASTVASISSVNGYTPEYLKDRISPALLSRVHETCKYFLK